ncbi:Uncharacterised protein [Mycobacteroides abscessus subsp. abscessus]|nr:Uncharacterised protein [Mycobacteroides abscessus subsp. abscessus]
MSTSNDRRPSPGTPCATRPGHSSTVVAGTIGSLYGASTPICAVASSAHDPVTPRERWSITLLVIERTPLASNADASESPA